MKKIKALWPNQKLVLVCRKGIGDFFLKTQVVDEVLEIKKGDSESYRQVLSKLDKYEIEKIFSPHESLRTAFFVRKLKAKQKIAFAKPWNGFFYQERIQKNYQLPEALRQLSLLQNLDEFLKKQLQNYSAEAHPYSVNQKGLLEAPPSWSSMSLRSFYDQRDQEIESVLQKQGLTKDKVRKSVALFPGSVWATKRWTEKGFVQTGSKLSQQGLAILVMGGPGEEELCARVAKQIPGAADLCAKTTIFESALILSQVAAVIGNDSASMHLAATAETPSVVIFGPTVLEFGFRPWQASVYVVERKGLSCRPCGKHGHKVCPIGTHECMKSIHKEEVLEKLEEILR